VCERALEEGGFDSRAECRLEERVLRQTARTVRLS